MKKKNESLKELLERLDEQAAQFNSHLAEANRFYDTAAKKMESLLAKEKKELHVTIQKVKKALKVFSKQKSGKDKA
jgi:hypothetical protein